MSAREGGRRDPGPPRGILESVPGGGLFRHERIGPPADLGHVVQHFWTVSWDLTGQGPAIRETLPHPVVHVVIGRNVSRVAGIAGGRFTRVLTGAGRVFGVKFRPGGFQPFAGGSVARFTGREVPLAGVFGAPGTRLGARGARGGRGHARPHRALRGVPARAAAPARSERRARGPRRRPCRARAAGGEGRGPGGVVRALDARPAAPLQPLRRGGTEVGDPPLPPARGAGAAGDGGAGRLAGGLVCRSATSTRRTSSTTSRPSSAARPRTTRGSWRARGRRRDDEGLTGHVPPDT